MATSADSDDKDMVLSNNNGPLHPLDVFSKKYAHKKHLRK